MTELEKLKAEISQNNQDIQDLYNRAHNLKERGNRLKEKLLSVELGLSVGDKAFFKGEPCVISGFDHKYDTNVLINKYRRGGQLGRRIHRINSWDKQFLTRTKEEYKPFEYPANIRL